MFLIVIFLIKKIYKSYAHQKSLTVLSDNFPVNQFKFRSLFIGQMESSGLQSMVNTMVWSVLEPAKASLSPESNIFQAFRSSRGNDCYAMAMFGMQYISLIRNGTNALKFFHAIQGMVARWL